MTVSFSDRWQTVQGSVARACKRAGRNPAEVQIVAVSKTVPADGIAEAYRAGVRIFGESYVQEALPKIDALASEGECSGTEWHFVGALQSNKARQAVTRFALIHSLDRWSLAKELDKEAKKASRTVRCLIEINVAGEATKSGVSPNELRAFAERISGETGLIVEGVMSFPPLAEDPELTRPYFRKTRECTSELERWGLPRVTGKTLSMGVTSDFEVAIEEGATLVRIGTALFGSRS
ncbi:MAG: YggS family pyridoxal phosphate-dependent enzyme [Pseudomonadota bacterium]